MKKYFLSLTIFAAFLVGCSQNVSEKSSIVTRGDSISQAMGFLLATDAVYNDLANNSPMIDEAVNDIFNGNVQKIHQAYAYINAIDMINGACSEMHDILDKDIIIESVHTLLAQTKDSLDFEKIKKYEIDAQKLVMEYLSEKTSKVHEDFLASVDQIEGIKKSESGLRYIVDKEGAKIGDTDNVKVNYVLYDYQGNIIDRSNATPFEFQLPSGVVPGFAEAVTIAGYGGKIRAWLPAEIGYGNQGQGQIAPGQVLIFEIEVLQK